MYLQSAETKNTKKAIVVGDCAKMKYADSAPVLFTCPPLCAVCSSEPPINALAHFDFTPAVFNGDRAATGLARSLSARHSHCTAGRRGRPRIAGEPSRPRLRRTERVSGSQLTSGQNKNQRCQGTPLDAPVPPARSVCYFRYFRSPGNLSKVVKCWKVSHAVRVEMLAPVFK